MANTTDEVRRTATRMLIVAFVAQNAASGFAFGSFGPMVQVFERELNVERSLSTAGLPLMILALSLAAPFIGRATHRFTLRQLMSAGAAMMAAGFVLIAFAPDILTVLLGYGLLIGPGYALLGVMLPSALVSRWYDEGVGRALGIINMPLFIGVVPLITAWVFPAVGRSGVFLGLAAAAICTLPLTLSIVDHPPRDREAAPGLDSLEHAGGAGILSLSEILRSGTFWLICLSGSIIGGAAISITTHIVPMAIGWGENPASAALLLSVLGFAGIAGSPLFGWLCDRLGGLEAMAVACVLLIALWSTLLVHPAFAILLPLALCLGIAGSGMAPTLASSIHQNFGSVNFSQVFGLFCLFSVPFLVGAPLLAGIIFDTVGDYNPAILIQAGLLAVGMIIALLARGRSVVAQTVAR